MPGKGIKAARAQEHLLAGSFKYIKQQVSVIKDIENAYVRLAEEGKTPLLFTSNGKLVGIIAVADTVKQDSPEAIKQLQDMGIRVVMLTGDNQKTANAIGRMAGVDKVVAQVLPDGKRRVITQLQQYGKVAMVGDGINDAPALTSADLGIAIGAGSDVAIDAADVVLMKSSLLDVPAAIRLSKYTLTNIYENLFWAFFYNVICIPLAIGLYQALFKVNWQMTPMLGAAAMSLSSFTVCTNALRLNLADIYRSDVKTSRKAVDFEIETEEATNMVKTLKIEGMMCPHCEATVKKALEKIEGVTNAEVSHERGTAIVTLARDVADDVLKNAVEEKDYTVTGIE